MAQITGIGAIITIIVNITLIPVFGMKGAAIATVLSYGTMAVILFRVAQKAMQILCLVRALGTMIVVSSVVWGFNLFKCGLAYQRACRFSNFSIDNVGHNSIASS